MSHRIAECESNLVNAAEHAAHVEWLPSVLEQIRETALEESNRHRPVRLEVTGEFFGKNLDINYRLPFRRRDVEVSGVLLGKREEARVRILAFRPLVSDQADGPINTLSEESRQALVALIAASQADHELHGLEPVGWFRAHPKSNLSLSKRDLAVFDYFFNEPWQIGLVLRPAVSGPTRATCFLRDVDGSIRRHRDYQEVLAPTIPDDATLRAERQPPPSAMQRTSPAAAPRVWQPSPSRAQTTPISPAVLLLGAVLGLGYWWIKSPEQNRFHPPHQRPAAGAEAEGHKQIEQEAAAMWKKWEQELREKQEVAALREKLEREALDKGPEELPNGLLKPPQAPVPVKPAAPIRADENRPTPRRSLAPATIPQERATARKLAPPHLVARETTPDASRHLKQSLPAPMVAKAAPVPPAVETPSAPPAAVSVPPPQKTATGPPFAPPPAAQASPAAMPREEQSSPAALLAKTTPANPAIGSSAAPRAAVRVTPSFGRLIWTGRLQKNGTVIIDGASASTGSITGELPGQPVRIAVWPGDLTDDGIVLYASHMQGARRALESPGPQNGWNKTLYILNPHRAADIAAVELPALNNGWKRLVLHSKSQRPSVFVVEWTLMP